MSPLVSCPLGSLLVCESQGFWSQDDQVFWIQECVSQGRPLVSSLLVSSLLQDILVYHHLVFSLQGEHVVVPRGSFPLASSLHWGTLVSFVLDSSVQVFSGPD